MRSKCLDSRVGPFENQFPNAKFERVETGPGIIRRNLVPVSGPSLGLMNATTRFDRSIIDDYVRFSVNTIADGPMSQRAGIAPASPYSVNVLGNRVYTISFDVRTQNASRLTTWGLYQISSGYTTVGSTLTVTEANVWTRVSLTILTPIGTTKLGFETGWSNSQPRALGEYLDIRRVLIEATPVALPHFDAFTPNTRGIAYGYESTVGNSPAVAYAKLYEVRRNLVPNPSMDTGPSGWSVNVSSSAVGSHDTSIGYSRPGSYRVDVDAAASYGAVDLQRWDGTTSGLIPVTPGDTVTFSARIRRSTIGSATAQIRWRNDALSEISARASQTFVSVQNDTWALVWVTAVVPVNVTLAHVGVGFEVSSGVAVSAWIDDALFEKTSIVLPYFDGYSTYDGDFTPSWTGTPYNSVSVLNALRPAGVGPMGYTMTRSWSGGVRNHRFEPGGTIWSVLGYLSEVTGRTYSVVIDLYAETAVNVSLSVDRSGGVGTSLGYIIMAQGETRRVKVTYVANVGTNPRVNAVTNFNTVLRVLSLTHVEGPYSGGPIDGDQPNFIWRGTPHDSRSFGYPDLSKS